MLIQRFMLVGIALTIVILGGCQMSKEESTEKDIEELPDVETFQDEFTQEFIQSKEEVMEGYYPFQSKTGKYRMAFPEDGKITRESYRRDQSKFEEIHISLYNEREFGLDVFFYSYHTPENMEGILRRFKKRLGYEGEFEKIEEKDKNIYFAQYERENARTYVAYIENTKSSGGLEVIYKLNCDNDIERECESNKKLDEESALQWMNSFEFIVEGDEKNE